MCGRYSLTSPGAALDLFVDAHATLPEEALAPRYNIAPTQRAPVVRRAGSARSAALLRWGLVPAFAKDPSVAARHINARRETVGEKPTFRDSLAERRCLVLADGFYEWQRAGKHKQAYAIHLPQRRPFAFAGLWATWRPRGSHTIGAEALETFAILTTAASPRIAAIHDRMPVILTTEEAELWLEGSADEASLWLAALDRRPPPLLDADPVSSHVNRIQNDDPECLTPVAIPAPTPREEPRQGSLF